MLAALQHEHRLRTEAEDLLRAIHKSRTHRMATRISSVRRGSAAKRVIPDFLTSRPAPTPLLFEPAADAATVADYTSWFHQHGARTWQHMHWFGAIVAKMPTDLWVYQEILFETRPQLIIECGTVHGGSALYFASLFDLLGEGSVVTVDVETQPDRPVHPRVTYLTGSSTAPEMAEQLRALAAAHERVMVILGSDHSQAHVAGELELYAPLVTNGCYLVVEDSVVNGNPILPSYGAGPMEALHAFLPEHPEFRVDAAREKFGSTFFPSGFLERVD
jgi:cephalosporin hydroxylase